MQFLNKMIYTGNNICANVFPSEALTDADEYFGEDCWIDEEAETTQTVQEADNMRHTYFVEPKDTAFLPCKHVCRTLEIRKSMWQLSTHSYFLTKRISTKSSMVWSIRKNYNQNLALIFRTEIESTSNLSSHEIFHQKLTDSNCNQIHAIRWYRSASEKMI